MKIIAVPGIGHERHTSTKRLLYAASWLGAVNEALLSRGEPAIDLRDFVMVDWDLTIRKERLPSKSGVTRVADVAGSTDVHAAGAATAMGAALALPIGLAAGSGALIARQVLKAMKADDARRAVAKTFRVTHSVRLPRNARVGDRFVGAKWIANIPMAGDVGQFLKSRQVVHYREQHRRRLRMLSHYVETIQPDEPVILIAHSLGSVVALQLLTLNRTLSERTVLFLTTGSPLWYSTLHLTILGDLKAVARAAKETGDEFAWPSFTIKRWVNIRDPRDIVATRALRKALDPRIVEVRLDGPRHNEMSLLRGRHAASAIAQARARL